MKKRRERKKIKNRLCLTFQNGLQMVITDIFVEIFHGKILLVCQPLFDLLLRLFHCWRRNNIRPMGGGWQRFGGACHQTGQILVTVHCEPERLTIVPVLNVKLGCGWRTILHHVCCHRVHWFTTNGRQMRCNGVSNFRWTHPLQTASEKTRRNRLLQ